MSRVLCIDHVDQSDAHGTVQRKPLLGADVSYLFPPRVKILAFPFREETLGIRQPSALLVYLFLPLGGFFLYVCSCFLVGHHYSKLLYLEESTSASPTPSPLCCLPGHFWDSWRARGCAKTMGWAGEPRSTLPQRALQVTFSNALDQRCLLPASKVLAAGLSLLNAVCWTPCAPAPGFLSPRKAQPRDSAHAPCSLEGRWSAGGFSSWSLAPTVLTGAKPTSRRPSQGP